MIYWFTGQPSQGKTVLANLLHKEIPEAFRIDGDDIRELFTNKDYTINGRIKNVSAAQNIAQYLNNQGHDVIVSLVSPYIDQREDFKEIMSDDIVEIYVHSLVKRERSHFDAIGYVAPKDNFIDIDTSLDTPEESLRKLLKELNG
jgi:adenylylsulfate kinase-like enzyme